jgi:TPR repeat protein
VAQIGLAASYFRGDGLPQDYAAAAMWYEQAAQQGNANAQCAVADHYARGLGVPRDDITALMWILVAGDRVTDENSALVPRIRDQLKSRMTQAQIGEARRRASQWRPMTCYG